MLAKNKSGWTLLEYLDIAESDICKYQNVTGAYAVLMIGDKFVVGYNSWRNQWEFPSGGIEKGETARQAAIRELYEETHQKIAELNFKGLIKVEDPQGIIKYQAVFAGCQNELLPFVHEENDEMEKIYLWDMKEDIGYVDECDIKIVELLLGKEMTNMFDKQALTERINALPFPEKEYWAVAGAAMVLHGFRAQTRDIDLGCSTLLADSLEQQGYPVSFCDDGTRKIAYSDDIEIFENWLEDTVEMIGGVPAVSKDGLIQMKKKLGREKDLADIALIEGG